MPNCDFFAIWYHFLAKTAPFSKNDPCLAKIRLVLPRLGKSSTKQLRKQRETTVRAVLNRDENRAKINFF